MALGLPKETIPLRLRLKVWSCTCSHFPTHLRFVCCPPGALSDQVAAVNAQFARFRPEAGADRRYPPDYGSRGAINHSASLPVPSGFARASVNRTQAILAQKQGATSISGSSKSTVRIEFHAIKYLDLTAAHPPLPKRLAGFLPCANTYTFQDRLPDALFTLWTKGSGWKDCWEGQCSLEIDPTYVSHLYYLNNFN